MVQLRAIAKFGHRVRRMRPLIRAQPIIFGVSGAGDASGLINTNAAVAIENNQEWAHPAPIVSEQSAHAELQAARYENMISRDNYSCALSGATHSLDQDQSGAHLVAALAPLRSSNSWCCRDVRGGLHIC